MNDSRMFRNLNHARVVAAIVLCALVVGIVPPQPQLRAEDEGGPALGRVLGMRLGVHPDRTRFVMDLSQSLEPSIFTLDDPYRVVIDLPEVDWQIEGDEPRGRGLVTGLRYGLFRPGNARVVLDLGAPAEIRDVSVLPPRDGYGFRLVIDLAETDRASFLRHAGWPAPNEAQAAATNLAVTPPQSPEVADRGAGKPMVVIDPGHGGVDPGAHSQAGILEKEIVLETALAIAKELESSGRYRVRLTREGDSFLKLGERVEVARATTADIFISLHADALTDDPSVGGLSIYTLSEKATDAEADALAHKENRADIIAGVDLRAEPDEVLQILIDLAQRQTLNQSIGLARAMSAEFGETVPLLKNPLRSAGFRVLTAPDIPSVLIELGFLSNADDETRVTSKAWREEFAGVLTTALDRYFSEAGRASAPSVAVGGPSQAVAGPKVAGP